MILDLELRRQEELVRKATSSASPTPVPGGPAAVVASRSSGRANRHKTPQAPTGAMAGKRYLDQYEVEALYGIPHRTLEGWRRVPGEGPPWRRFGKKSIKYQVAALEAWVGRQEQGGDGVPS
jgi:hypothetical protein